MLTRRQVKQFLNELGSLLLHLGKSILFGTIVGVLAGVASALFLTGLKWATETRTSQPSLLYLLPLAGGLIGWIYTRYGKDVEGGNNLLLDTIHEPSDYVSWRMAPLIALSTIGTHLFGGSAGREGTAVQMGGSLADAVSRLLRFPPASRRIMLMSGISGGFGSVFGTPLAGTVFGMEVLTIGRVRYDALLPCFIASTIGDMTCKWLGVGHHNYHLDIELSVNPPLLGWIVLAGICFGLASFGFAELVHGIGRLSKRLIPHPVWRPFVGGLLIIGMTLAVGTHDYLGLSLPLIERSFDPEPIARWAFLMKIVFTAVTLGTGFKGGEVTPLFCIGATLGHTFAIMTGQQTEIFAAVGFVAVFAGAANTPISCVLMGMELFGSDMAVPLMLGCIVSYIASGHRGIYTSQKVHTPKHLYGKFKSGATLREMHDHQHQI